jgi:hypothetical protein
MSHHSRAQHVLALRQQQCQQQQQQQVMGQGSLAFLLEGIQQQQLLQKQASKNPKLTAS